MEKDILMIYFITPIEGGNLIYEMGKKPAETCFDKYSLPYSLSSGR